MANPATLVLGPMFIGLIFNTLLYGVMVTQIFLYFTKYKRDKLWLKIFVIVLLAADTLTSAFDVACVYIPLVTNFGNPYYIEFAFWVDVTEPVMTGICAMMVQMFFAWRIKVLTNNIPLVCLVVFSSIVMGCGALGTSIAIHKIPAWEDFHQFKAIVIVWLVGAIVTDTLITASLVLRLKQHDNGFPGTTDRLNKIIRLTVQTGLATTIIEIVHLVTFLALATGIHLIFNLPLGRLYTNSLMSTLNARASDWNNNSVLDANPGSMAVSRERTLQFSHNGAKQMTSPEVFVDIEAHQMVDVADKKALRTM